ncbi:hypothetical protein GGS26DRAFT_594785 [Hypomontagnella submonticulosa]|nr:hypothetical protein GGS26DRAFT_594785 [Hypomontagnella submonticulosa]
MAPTRLARPPTCLSCLRRLAQPSSSPSPFLSLPLAQQQTRGVKTTKAEEEDLQGIPVRLLQNMPGFGRKHAIIRVKPGRMRNYWFPRAQAEYMTRQRFQELGLTEDAIGVRDRTFGNRSLLDQDTKPVLADDAPVTNKSKKDTLTLPPEETLTLLQTLLPPTLTFARKPIPAVPAAPPTPSTPRSPSLAPHAALSTDSHRDAPEPAAPEQPAAVAIFGSVSTTDILALIRERLLEADPSRGGRVALEADGVAILGLEDEGEDRIKRLGTFEVLITAGRDLEPVRRTVEVVAEE